MRRFLIWSALAVVIGLALAGTGYWAYWNFYARFQPVTLNRNQAEIQRLLDEASWLSEGGGGEPLYVIGYRDSVSTQRYEREEGQKLRAAGVELRSIVFARPDRDGQPQSTPAERATVAELWLTRDWSLYQRWLATPPRNWTAAGIPAADGNLARSAVVEGSRQFVSRLNALLRDSGAPVGYPLVVWRDPDGVMKACACADSRSWAFIRDDFAAPDTVAAADAPEAEAPLEPIAPAPEDAPPESLPYPSLGPIPPVTQPIPPASGQGPSTATRPATTPSTPPQSRQTPPPSSRQTPPRTQTRPNTPPRPSQGEDTTFF